MNYVDANNDSVTTINYEKNIEKALNNAIAILAIDGMIITDVQKEEFKKQLLMSKTAKILYKKRQGIYDR